MVSCNKYKKDSLTKKELHLSKKIVKQDNFDIHETLKHS